MIEELPRVQLAAGYSISRVLKGGWQLADGHSAAGTADALADMDRFVEAGITTFDCADIYSGVEALIGEWMKRHRARSDPRPVQIHTKYVPDLDRLPMHSRADVVRGIDRSLARLNVERLDLVQLHWWDYDVPGYVDAAAWLDEMRRAGKIRHLGLTNFDVPRLDEIAAAGIPIVSHQVQYSLLDRRPAERMAAWCAERGIGLLCYGAVAGGFLSERYLATAAPTLPLENRSLVKYRLIVDEAGGWSHLQALLAGLEAVAKRHSVGIGAVAIRWVLDQTCVSGVIVGARHARHLDQIVEAARLSLDEEDRATLARLLAASIGPGGDVYELERVKGGRHASVMRYSLNRDRTSETYPRGGP